MSERKNNKEVALHFRTYKWKTVYTDAHIPESIQIQVQQSTKSLGNCIGRIVDVAAFIYKRRKKKA